MVCKIFFLKNTILKMFFVIELTLLVSNIFRKFQVFSIQVKITNKWPNEKLIKLLKNNLSNNSTHLIVKNTYPIDNS